MIVSLLTDAGTVFVSSDWILRVGYQIDKKRRIVVGVSVVVLVNNRVIRVLCPPQDIVKRVPSLQKVEVEIGHSWINVNLLSFFGEAIDKETGVTIFGSTLVEFINGVSWLIKEEPQAFAKSLEEPKPYIRVN